MVPIHIFLSDLWPFDIGRSHLNFACGTPLLTFVPSYIEIYLCMYKFYSKQAFYNDLCDLDISPRDPVYAHNTAFQSGEHFYEVS
jgi:hypothetical protein